MTAPDRIVVGYDGSPEAALAVRWAARHAALLDLELQVVHCSLWPLLTHDLGPVKGVAGSGLQHQAQTVLDEGKAEAQSVAPGVPVQAGLFYGLPAVHLRRIAENAGLLVLGSRGIGGFLGLLVGSVSLELAATAPCPVAVIRFDKHPEGRVVVGIDSSGSAGALRLGGCLARATGAPLAIVHVIHAHYDGASSAGERSTAARRLLEQAAEQAKALAPTVAVSGDLVRDHSVARALLNASRGAALTVVGSKAHHLLKGTVGSSAHAVLHHATGPVLISRT
jgi:nucleotide-binding universal stress UspA family protein